MIFKLIQIHALVIYQIQWIDWISVPLWENSTNTFPPQLEVAVDGNASSLILNNRIPRMFWQAWQQEELILPYTREIKQLQWDSL